MTKPADIAVHGSGITAHATALLMADAGLSVQVSTPHAKSAAGRDIRAYAINHASKATLTRAGAWPVNNEAAWLTPVKQMRVFGDGAGQLALDGTSQGLQAIAWMVDVPALEDALQRLVSTHSRIGTCAQGVAPSGSLHVLCEGKHSALRAQLGLEAQTLPYPHRALAARLRASEPHGGVAQQWFDGESILALLPVGGPSGCDLAMVWSMPQATCRSWEQRSANESTALLQAISTASRHTYKHLSFIGLPLGFDLSLSRSKAWVQPGVALVGDSAHTVHPLAGLGLNMGLADVQALVDVVAGRGKGQSVADMRLLRRYQRARAGDTASMQWATHGLFHLFTSAWGNTAPVQVLRNWGMLGVNAATPLKRWIQAQAMRKP